MALACISIVGAVGCLVAECGEQAHGGRGGRTGGNEVYQFAQCRVIHSGTQLNLVSANPQEMDRHCR